MQNVKKMVVRKANINNPFTLGQRDWVSAGLQKKKENKMKTKFILIIFAMMCTSLVHAETTTYIVTANTLNVRSGAGEQYKVIGKLHKGDKVRVLQMHNSDWATIRWQLGEGYVSRSYIALKSSKKQTNKNSDFKISSLKIGNLIRDYYGWGILFISLFIVFPILQKYGQKSTWRVTYIIWYILSYPFYILDLLQFWLAKPWRPFMKENILQDGAKKFMRVFLRILQFPFYVLLLPLRIINAIYYNILIHNTYELLNYFLEVVEPSHPKEGHKNIGKWIIFLPKRILKYLLYHSVLTFIESIIWTVADVIFPAMTLYHGTSTEATNSILCEPTRNRKRITKACRTMGIWNVGAGNFAGDGIYFGIYRKTFKNYSRGSLIVARVTTGKAIDTVLIPNSVYDKAGSWSASAVSNWGLRNGYVSGEWWRTTGSWWEICLYDRKNKYNESWRIRHLYAVSSESGIMQRIPGGSAHWLFRKVILKDIWYSITHIFRK